MPLQDQNQILAENVAILSSTVLTDVFDGLPSTTSALITGSTGVGATSLTPEYVVIKTKQAFAGGTNVTFNLRNSSTVDTNGALSGTVNTVTSATVLTAALTANRLVSVLALPSAGTAGALRYWDIQAVNSGTFTSGTFTAYVASYVESLNIPGYPIATIA